MGRPVGSGIVPLEDRFWSKVIRLSEDECWLWTGSKDSKGYGQIRVDTCSGWKLKTATHVVWFICSGEYPRQWMLHTCDNPPCVNPKHLREGDAFDNMRDMASKGRDSISKHGWNHIFGHRTYTRRLI